MIRLKVLCHFLILGLVLCVVSGMSGMGGESGPSKIPSPDKNFAATVIDRADVRTEVTHFSIDGLTYFFGQKGMGKVAIPFDKISRADFSIGPDALAVLIKLKDGKTETLTADRNQTCSGISSLGNYQISLGDIKALTINRQVLPSASKNK